MVVFILIVSKTSLYAEIHVCYKTLFDKVLWSIGEKQMKEVNRNKVTVILVLQCHHLHMLQKSVRHTFTTVIN